MPYDVPQFQPHLGEPEIEAARKVIESGWITEGPRCEEFVERIKTLAGVQYGVLAPNGTLALYLALKALGVGEDRRPQFVIVPDLTFAGSATAVIMAGAQPLFADVNRYGQLAAASAALHGPLGPRRLCMPVDLYGAASNEVPEIAWSAPGGDKGPAQYMVEDACEALGVRADLLACGSLCRVSAFSFFADKLITTAGEGGFVGTNDKDVYEQLLYLRNQGRINRGSFIHPRLGQNFRLTDVQAAVGLAQLDQLGSFIKARRDTWRIYRDAFSGTVDVLGPPPGSTHIPFRTVVFFDGAHGGRQGATEAAEFLRQRGVEPRSAFYPLHRQPCFKPWSEAQLENSLYSNANRFYETALCLPSWPGLESWQIEQVIEAVNDFVFGEPS